MKKKYEPKEIEKKWQKFWEEKDYFSPHSGRKGDTFSMVMPPPNITGILHMGHALNNTLQDIMARFKRMQGYEVLWIPGIDHAGIATQNVVERELSKKGLSRQKIGREEFNKRVWEWKDNYGERIFSQLKNIGISCSWKHKSFTMDKKHSKVVREVFVRLYEQGYIYRGDYIINWCPRCQTALSDIEVEYEEKMGKLYYIKYPFKEKENYLIIATTRPETMLGDTAVAVNPKDKRFENLKGKKLILPLVNRELPLIYDEYVDPKFGTGALKVTPAHDPNDFLIGKRHNLPFINILNPDGTINKEGGIYEGLKRFKCREKLINDLKEKGYLKKIEDYTLRIGHCYRCKTLVEPYLSPQWFVKMGDLAQEAVKVVKEGEIEFVPSFWKKSYFRWMEEIHDWCISRQIWWGHQIPAWFCQNCGKITVSINDLKECSYCGSKNLKKDEDVLDTWFSSSLWPFSTLGWPERGEEFKNFYPTSLLCSGWDILFFWVSRMIMMGLKFTNEIPFRKVYIHPLIGDEKGKKMSKSKGNVIDPLVLMEKYGTDAFRFSLIALKTDSPYVRFSEERVRGYRNFANKIWNASRFTLMNLQDFQPQKRLENEKSLKLSDRWILSRYSLLIKRTNSNLNGLLFSETAQLLYQFIWGEFCDWYIELTKPRLLNKKGDSSRYTAQWTLYKVLKGTLKILHPFMPFITEEIYQRLPRDKDDKESIMISSWPESEREDKEAEKKMNLIMEVIQDVRTIRSEMRIPPQKEIDLALKTSNEENLNILRENNSYIVNLIKTNQLLIDKDITPIKGSISSLSGDVEIFIPLKDLIDIEKERKRLKKDIEKLNKELFSLEKKFSYPQFLSKAPPEIIEKEKEKRETFQCKIKKIKQRLKEME